MRLSESWIGLRLFLRLLGNSEMGIQLPISIKTFSLAIAQPHPRCIARL